MRSRRSRNRELRPISAVATGAASPRLTVAAPPVGVLVHQDGAQLFGAKGLNHSGREHDQGTPKVAHTRHDGQVGDPDSIQRHVRLAGGTRHTLDDLSRSVPRLAPGGDRDPTPLPPEHQQGHHAKSPNDRRGRQHRRRRARPGRLARRHPQQPGVGEPRQGFDRRPDGPLPPHRSSETRECRPEHGDQRQRDEQLEQTRGPQTLLVASRGAAQQHCESTEHQQHHRRVPQVRQNTEPQGAHDASSSSPRPAAAFSISFRSSRVSASISAR